MGTIDLPAAQAAPSNQAAQPAVPEQSTAPQQGEIVVTATRRSTRLRDTPLAITAISGETLRKSNVSNFADFARTVPGLQFTDYGNGRPKPTLRGINVNIRSAAIGYYIDEAPVPTSLGTLRNTTIDLRLFDIARIEVLRGPQGTLYGSGSMGGTIRIIPNRPDPSSVQASAQGSVEPQSVVA